jgi:hypothetical protein
LGNDSRNKVGNSGASSSRLPVARLAASDGEDMAEAAWLTGAFLRQWRARRRFCRLFAAVLSIGK